MNNHNNSTGIPDQTKGIAPGIEIMGFDEIRNLLPHEDPFILVDKVLELEKGKRIICLKNISGNDPWFRGHFPGFAVMPGVLILEALAQSMSILVLKSNPNFENKWGVLGSVKARFSKPVVPGDQLIMEVEIDKIISTGAVVSAVARVNDEKVATAGMTFGLYEKDGK